MRDLRHRLPSYQIQILSREPFQYNDSRWASYLTRIVQPIHSSSCCTEVRESNSDKLKINSGTTMEISFRVCLIMPCIGDDVSSPIGSEPTVVLLLIWNRCCYCYRTITESKYESTFITPHVTRYWAHETHSQVYFRPDLQVVTIVNFATTNQAWFGVI